MAGDNTHLKLRVGDLEIEYQGSASFLRSELLDLVRQVVELRQVAGSYEEHEVPSPAVDLNAAIPDSQVADVESSDSDAALDMSITSVASRLDVKSGPDLAIAAAAFLTFCEEKETFSRAEIRETMKKAHGYYKQTMTKNLTASLQRLLQKDCLRQTKADHYTLAIVEKERLHAALTDNS